MSTLHVTQQQPVDLADIYCFIAILIYMGIVHLPAITDYWRKSQLYSLPYPSVYMSCRRFQMISTAIHMSDPADDAVNDSRKGTPGYDRLQKIKPMYHHLRENCKTYFHPDQHIAIDERMVASRARIGIRQYMKDKPTKWGYKLFVLADSVTGYTWDFFVYQGKGQIGSGKGLSYDSVMELVSAHLLGAGYKLYVDHFYTSTTLFKDLLEKKVWACGTIRENRIGYPKGRSGGVANKDPRGTLRWIREGSALFVQWKDTRTVNMCSTMHCAHSGATVQRRVKDANGQWSVKTLPIPPAVQDNNRYNLVIEGYIF